MRTLPILLLGTAAMTIVVLIVSWAELVTGKIMIGFLQLPPVVLPLLFLLVATNRGLGRPHRGGVLCLSLPGDPRSPPVDGPRAVGLSPGSAAPGDGARGRGEQDGLLPQLVALGRFRNRLRTLSPQRAAPVVSDP